jgi:L-ascorbate metabolism protein UlaG (beta-lactamase superfamily)
MDLTFLGAGCVKLSGKTLTVICDPYSTEAGLPAIGGKAELITKSSPENLGDVNGVGMIFDSPGEYEIKGVTVIGVPAQLHLDEGGERGTVFSFQMDGVGIVVLGNVFGKLPEKQVERLGRIDVLVVPVGNHGLTLDAAGAAELVSQLEPSYVVPVHFDDGVTTYPVPQDDVSHFLKEMGATISDEPITKLKVNSKELPPETLIVVLQRA